MSIKMQNDIKQLATNINQCEHVCNQLTRAMAILIERLEALEQKMPPVNNSGKTLTLPEGAKPRKVQ